MRETVCTATVVSVLVGLATGCAVRSHVDLSPRYKDGDPCTFTETYLSKTCGYMTGAELRGRALYRSASNAVRPVSGVRVYESKSEAGATEAMLLCRGDESGIFKVVRSVNMSDTQWCRRGTAVTERYVVPTGLVLRADGCDDLDVEVRPESDESFEMTCQGRPPG